MRRVAIALVALAAAGGLAGWWFWPRAQRNLDARQNREQQLDARAVAGAAARPAVLMLEVNDARKADVRPGESVFFSVSLSGTSPKRAFRIGAPGRPWSAELRFETADGKPVPMKIEQLGSPYIYPSRRDPKTPEPGPSEPGQETVVDDSRILLVDFGLGPDESARLAGGTYNVRVVLPLASAPEGVKLLASNTVSVRVQPAATGGSPSPDHEKARLVAAARFYLQSEKWLDAHRIALQLIERQDAGAAGFALLADSLNGLRRDDEALAAYQEALAALPRDLNESPDYLIARMEAVRQRLEALKEKKE